MFSTTLADVANDTAVRNLALTFNAAPQKSVGPHPRVYVTAAQQAAWAHLAASGDYRWTAWYNWLAKRVKNDPTAADPFIGYTFTAAAFAGVVLPDSDPVKQQAFNFAWNNFFYQGGVGWVSVPAGIYKNGKDNSGGFRNVWGVNDPTAIYGADGHAGGTNGSALIMQLSQFYDWMYNELTPQQRLDIVNWMNQNCQLNHDNNPGSHDAQFRNDGILVLASIGFNLAATYESNPMTPTLQQWFDTDWNTVKSGLDITGTDGGSPEGNSYGVITAGTLYQPLAR